VRNPRFKVVNIVEHLYEISIILDAYHCSPFSRSMRSDPLNQTFANIQSMMGQARQDAETTLLDESNSARVKLSPRELDRLYLVVGHKPRDEMCQQCAFCVLLLVTTPVLPVMPWVLQVTPQVPPSSPQMLHVFPWVSLVFADLPVWRLIPFVSRRRCTPMLRDLLLVE
jgi:hypothetical protein